MRTLSSSSWAQKIEPSPTLVVDAKAKELKAKGFTVFGFGAGEPDCDTPEFIKEACIKALKDGKTKYVPTGGIPELREAIAHKYISSNKLKGSILPSQVLVSPGGKFSCYIAILATCSPGDEVLIPAPYWVSYPEMVKMAGAFPKILQTEATANFKLSADLFEKNITPKTRLLILNSPSNPTGAVYSQNEIRQIMQVAIRHNIYVLSDEIYEYLTYDQIPHFSPAALSDEAAALTMTVSGFSKTFSMTGWRIGTLVASPTIAKAAENLQMHMTSNSTSFAQYGALEALLNTLEFEKFLKNMLLVFDQRRRLLHRGLLDIQNIRCFLAQGAFYLFPDISAFGMPSALFAQKLLEQENVALVPGSAFGNDNYVRLSYATNQETIEKGLLGLKKFCENCKKSL